MKTGTAQLRFLVVIPEGNPRFAASNTGYCLVKVL
jgi:hypothetical protein